MGSQSSSPDYETVLARLATDINEAKTHLSEIRLRERRISLLINLYGIGLWALWVGLWWVHGLPLGLIGLSHKDVEGKAVEIAGIAGGPIFIWMLNRLLHFYFTRQRSREETHLRLLLTQQRKQVEEIKKATNYDLTRKLIEQYDSPSPNGPQTPQRRHPESPSPAGHAGSQKMGGGSVPAGGRGPGQMVQGPGGTPRAPGHLVGAGGTPESSPGGQPLALPKGLSPEQAAALTMQMHSMQPMLPTPEKRWYDRVVDSILGEDPSQAAQSKYALVCGECFRHNGLVGSKFEWERMQWICPRCNHLNPPPLSRSSPAQGLTTPSKPVASPAQQKPPPSTLRSGPSPKPRRLGARGADKGTPRSSRLGKEVFNASSSGSEDEDGEDGEEEVSDTEKMEVDLDEK
ncbi:hypothetical protein I317_01401 [Kwoniella heveanensis CBS 569]|nr:hypothetical protein I317_01401 [Kwoniella heveanensis CBS 569]